MIDHSLDQGRSRLIRELIQRHGKRCYAKGPASMTTMIAEVYDALKSAGADDDKARAAAEAIAGHRDATTDLQTEMRTEFADIRGELKLLKWMLGFVLVGVAGLIVKALV